MDATSVKRPCWMTLWVGCAVSAALSLFGQAQPPPTPATPGAHASSSTGVSPVPRIQFATPIHDFGRVVSGAVVRHDFLFTNTGQAVLEISNVHASCGCTTAGEWSRRVEPGQTGVIPIQLNTAGFQGLVVKPVTITCNDPQQPNVSLQVRALIWTPIELTPRYAVLHANPERLEQARAVVHIVNREEVPLRLEAPESSSPHLKAEIVERDPGQAYDLLIMPTGVPPPGNTQGLITVPTSSTNLPQLSVTTLLLMQPVVTVAPPFIQLAPGPLPAPQTVAVAVMNNGTNRLRLSGVSVNDTNVTVEVQETNPGHYFNVLLHFPAGFQLPPGRVLALTGQTSHPSHPEFRIPIAQSSGPIATPPPAPAVPSAVAPAGSAALLPGRTAPSPAPPVQRPVRSPVQLPPTPGQ